MPGNGGRIVRLKDVGRVELGAQTYAQDFKVDGKPAAGLAIYQTPEANALGVADRGREEDGGAEEGLPRRASNTARRSTPRRS